MSNKRRIGGNIVQENISIRGFVEKIIFRNSENGYTVLNVNVSGNEVTFVGEFPFVSEGETIDAIGTWVQHSKFGTQFQVKSYQTYFPSDSNDIIRYLSSGVIKGLGLVTTEKIVKKFGNETLEIIKNNPEKIYEVKGIPRSKAKKIIEEFDKILGIKTLSSELEKYDMTTDEIIKIWKNLGNSAVEIINDNPYILCDDLIGVDFEKVDAIAEKLGKDTSDKFRINTGINYVLKHNLNNGHTCLPKHKLLPTVAKFLNVDEEYVNECIEKMLQKEELKQYNLNENVFLFLPDIYDSEEYCFQRIMMMVNFSRPISSKNISEKIEYQENVNNIKYAPLQKDAISKSISGNILILTGGPGTGKTTTLKAIINTLESMDEKVLLSAPTGRAAQRMSELTGKEAKTIHRMLEVGWENNKAKFHRNESNLLDCDVLIIDEFSMVDLLMLEGVLRALPLNSRLIIVGDTNQLPSVGPGNLLGDMIDSNLIPVIRLKEIFRQSKESLIITNSHKIVNGTMPELHRTDSDFFFIKNFGEDKICETILDLCKRRLPKSYGYSPLSDIQIICPSKVGNLGANVLNQKLQETLNPKTKSKCDIIINGKTFRENDKVMQNKNNYDIYWEKANGECGQGIFNGEIGVIIEIDKVQCYIVVKFDDRIAVYDFASSCDLELAYAITVHKSQGSEFKAVIVPVFGKSRLLNYRNLLYTAVTRAQKILILVGIEQTVKLMVDNNIRIKRYSALKNMMEQESL